MKPLVLLLEDDPAIAGTVVYALEREGLTALHLPLVQEAEAAVRQLAPAVAVLDVGLHDGNGLDLCRRWRHDADPRLARLPILMLTARGEEIDRVLGLEAGADDYLAKPFSLRELVARVRALLRRAAMPAAPRTEPDFEFDEPGQRIRYAGAALPLTRLEYGLLRELLLARGRILSREALLNRVWGADAESADRTVDTHIKTLRAKLRVVQAGGDSIVTHRGLGYMLLGPPGP